MRRPAGELYQQLHKLFARWTCARTAATSGRPLAPAVKIRLAPHPPDHVGSTMEDPPVITKAPFLGLTGFTTIGRSGSSALTPRSTALARVLKHPHDVLRSGQLSSTSCRCSRHAAPHSSAITTTRLTGDAYAPRSVIARSAHAECTVHGGVTNAGSSGLHHTTSRETPSWRGKGRSPSLDR